MARVTNRAGGHKIESAPAPAKTNARPASSSDPVHGPTHPASRKGNATGGHGNSGQGGGGSK